MTTERFYRVLLLAYPRTYRDQRGAELLSTLLDAAEGTRAPHRRGVRWTEGLSLLRHGLSLRVHAATLSFRDRLPALGLAGLALAVVLGVLGLHQLLANAVRATGLHGFPSEWGLYTQWVDPRWPVHAAWLATALALLTRRVAPATVCAGAAALLHAWYLLAAAATGGEIPWAGNVGPFWFAPSGTAELGWFVLSLGAAILLRGARGTADDLAPGIPQALRRAAVLGAAVTLVTIATGPVLRALQAEVTAPPYRFEGPLPALMVTAAALAWALLRTEHGRAALLVLVILASAPLATRWTESFAAAAGVTLLFAAGYLAASLRAPGPPVSQRP
jgi:hypothetical protein